MRNCPWHIVDSSRRHYHHYQTLPPNTWTGAGPGRFMGKGIYQFSFSFRALLLSPLKSFCRWMAFCSTGGSECRDDGVAYARTLVHCKVLRTYKHIRHYIAIIMMTIFSFFRFGGNDGGGGNFPSIFFSLFSLCRNILAYRWRQWATMAIAPGMRCVHFFFFWCVCVFFLLIWWRGGRKQRVYIIQ